MPSMPPEKMAPPIPTSYAESHAEKMKAALELSRMFASPKTNTKTQGLCQSSKKGSKQKASHSTGFKQDEVDISKPIVYSIPSDVTAWLTGGSSSSTPLTPRLPISSKTTSASVSIVSHSKIKVHEIQTSIPSGSPRNIGQPGRPQKPMLQVVDIEKAQDCRNLSSERPTAAPTLKLEPDLIDMSPLSPHQSQLSSTSDYLSDLRGLSFDGITIPGKTEISAKPKTGLAASRWAD
ncbi:hypothetical protein CFIMG_000535RAa [Ceratocystis fimbriata CBS 114723]|uniref:Uncharacterized protein n=1 Tax=Ceratocystis fimbriata CBS 114723 TaxID=1035309 RepID=A0A2C5XH65_9PEZI|nr:hypothetical protein CFIMG_000535RAa [Ceratocystis fimbriata CBS 114723]